MSQHIEVAHILLSKPKKSENSTYVSAAHYETKKNPVVISLDNSYVIHTNVDKAYASIKTASVESYNQIYDIAAHIVSIVKANFASWFNTQMSEDLVDEYFNNPLVYDKKYGDIIRLKVVDGLEHITDLKRRCNLVLILDHIRIYKQKFQLEWTIKDVSYGKSQAHKELDDDIVDPQDVEDMCIPIEEIRQEYIAKLTDKLDVLNELLALLKTADTTEVAEIAERVSEYILS